MAVPKQRQNSSRSKRRRGGHRKLEKKKLVKCANCQQLIQPHHLCSFCGYYGGKEVVKVAEAKK